MWSFQLKNSVSGDIFQIPEIVSRHIEKTVNLSLMYGMSQENFRALHSATDHLYYDDMVVVLVKECNRFNIDDNFLIGRDVYTSMKYFKKYFPKSVFRRIKKLKSKSLGQIYKEVRERELKYFKELGT